LAEQVWLLELGVRPWNDGRGEKRIRRRRDHNLAPSLIGKQIGQNSFGGKLLSDNGLQRKNRVKEVKKGWRRQKNIFANCCKLLKINNIFFWACPSLCVGNARMFDLSSTVRVGA